MTITSLHPFPSLFFCGIGPHPLIISREMPQLGQLGPLMAVIASCFTNLSLICLTVCLPPCCNPSILITSELNDQWRLCGARDHHFSVLLRRNLQRAQATKPSRACLLSAVNALKLQYMMFLRMGISFYWFLVLSRPCAAYIWRQRTAYWRSI